MRSIKKLFTKPKQDINRFSLKDIQEFVENSLERMRRFEIDTGVDYEERKKLNEKRNYLIKISKDCGKGDISAKLYMKRYILDLITEYGVNEKNIDSIFEFNNPQEAQDKFEIILYKYKTKFKYRALTEIIEKYGLDKFRKSKEVSEETNCIITDDDINEIFCNENFNLKFEDKLEILVQRIYQNVKGLGAIDEIRDMFCDGLSLGVSGVPVDFIGKLSDMTIRQDMDCFSKYKISYDSIWLYFKGKEIYLKFLSFGSQHELERVCRLIYRYHDAPQLTRSEGYIFNYMADLSRVAVFRPPFVEGWCAFIRKFDVDPELDTLFSGENYDIVEELLHFQGRGKAKVVVTGQQGTGKTTLLIAILRRMYPNITLRVWEDYFETFLRLKMPNRNIMTIRRTEHIGGEKGIDALKKSNGQVTVITEAAEDEQIKYIVKVALAASETILYTHHANDENSLVASLRNGAINSGAFTNEDIAEDQVLKTLEFDDHLFKDPSGKRYIERITEFIVDDEDQSEELEKIVSKYNDTNSKDEKMDIMFNLMTNVMLGKSIKKKKYKTVNIIEYDFSQNKYVVKNKISDKKKVEIMKNLLPEDKEKFKKFITKMESMIEEKGE